jgi:SynChlorMet cassette radical SAM/SPASM protein ScmE
MTPPPLMKTPRSVDLEITTACNLRCRYCSHFSSPGDVTADLPTAEWRTFFEELGNLGVMSVVLSGGEPLLRPDILELIESIVKNRMRFDILTNGTKVTEDLARAIASTKRCNYVQVSIDGATADVHDSYRGKGVFHKAVSAIRTLKEAGVRVTVRVTIHRKNYETIDDIARFLLEDLGLPGFSTNYASYMGLFRDHPEEVQLTVDNRISTMNNLVRLARKYPGRITGAAGPLAEARAYASMDQARSKGKPGWAGYLAACGCPWSKITVRADGVIIPCTHLSHIELGRINHDSLLDIWQNHPDLQRLRSRKEIPLSNFPQCAECGYQPYCTGNCPGVAYNITGDVYAPSPESCLKVFLASGGKIEPEWY